MELVIASFALGIAVATGICLYRTRTYLIATRKSLVDLQAHVLDVGDSYNRAIKAQGETLDLLTERLDGYGQRLDDHAATLENHRGGLIDHKKFIDDHSSAMQVMLATDERLGLTVSHIGQALTELEKVVDPDTPIFNVPPKH